MPQDNPENLSAIIALAIFLLPIIVALFYRYKAKKLKGSLAKSQLEITTIKAERDSLIETLKPITDVKQEAGRLYSEADAANLNAKAVLKAAKEKAQELVDQGQSEADKTIESAKSRAQEIAGSALEAKEKADSYAAAIKAMKNTIEGYQDDYIIPNHTVLDDLADEYSHKEAGEQLKLARKRVKDMVKDVVQPTVIMLKLIVELMRYILQSMPSTAK